MGAVSTAQGFGTQANYVNNSSSNNFALGTGTPSNGDIYQLAIDADNNKVWIGLNNSWNDASGGTTGNPSSGTNHTIALTFGSDAQIGFQRTNSSPKTGIVATSAKTVHSPETKQHKEMAVLTRTFITRHLQDTKR